MIIDLDHTGASFLEVTRREPTPKVETPNGTCGEGYLGILEGDRVSIFFVRTSYFLIFFSLLSSCHGKFSTKFSAIDQLVYLMLYFSTG